MAEGFARRYGSDVLEVSSAGLAPAAEIPIETLQVMEEKNIFLEGHFPKNLNDVGLGNLDLVVNMSGIPLPPILSVPVREWKVPDPVGKKKQVHRKICEQVESLGMNLILEVRRNKE